MSLGICLWGLFDSVRGVAAADLTIWGQLREICGSVYLGRVLEVFACRHACFDMRVAGEAIGLTEEGWTGNTGKRCQLQSRKQVTFIFEEVTRGSSPTCWPNGME